MKFLSHIKTFLGITVVSLAMFFIITGITEKVTPPTLSATESKEKESTIDQSPISYFKNLDLEAKAAHVFDLKTQSDIFTLNVESSLPIASLAKLMTALVALEKAPSDSTLVTIGPDALLQDGDSGFSINEQWNLETLLDVTLVSSSNDGAYAIAASIMPFLNTQQSEKAFVDAMNERARELGLSHTSFLTPTGLDINNDTEPSAYSSARDITQLFAYILKLYPEILEATRSKTITRTSLNSKIYNVQNTNSLIPEIPLLIGSKTGFTDSAGGNLIIAFDAGLAHPIIITVLGSSPEGRFTDMKTLIDATLKYTTHDS